MKKLIIGIFTFLFCLSVSAQSHVIGIVKDEQGEPIPFASIGYYQRKAGGISDSNGLFSLPKHNGDSIKISAIGFEPSNIFIDSSVKYLSIILNRKVQTLSEIILESRRKTNKKISLGYFGLNGKTFTDRGNIEVQQAYFIPNESYIHGYIDEVKFKLRESEDKGLSLRLRLLRKDSATGLPGTDLLVENYIIKPRELKRNTVVNVKRFNIRLPKEGVFISLEWFCLEEKCKALLDTEIPALPGGKVTAKNERYLNYKEMGWVATPLGVAGAYAIPGIGITISY
jgi:hypothetical protein